MKTFIKTVMAVSVLAASMGASATAGPANDIAQRLQNVYDSFDSNFHVTGGTGFTSNGDAVKDYGQLLYMIDAEERIEQQNGQGQVVIGINDGGYIYADSSDVVLDSESVVGESFTDIQIKAQVAVFVDQVELDLFGQQGSAEDGTLYSISGGGDSDYRGEGTGGVGGLAGVAVNTIVTAANNVNAILTLGDNIDGLESSGPANEAAALASFHSTFDVESERFNNAVASLGDVSSSLAVANADGYNAFNLNGSLVNGVLTVGGITNNAFDGAGIGLEMTNNGDVYTSFLLNGSLNVAANAQGNVGIGYTTTVENFDNGIVIETKTYDQGRTITTTYNADGTIGTVVDSQDPGA